MGENLSGKITSFAFYAVVIFLLVWTAFLDYSFIRRVVTDQPFLAFFGLVLFDGGLLGWLTTYIYRARGSTQRLLSLVMTILSLIGIGILSAAELLEQAGELVRFDIQNLPTIVVILISVQTFLFVASTVLFHLSDPDIMERVNMQAIEDEVIQTAFDLFDKNKKETAMQLATTMSTQMLEHLVAHFDNRLDPNSEWEYEVKRHKKGYTQSKKTAAKSARRRIRRQKAKEEKKETEASVW